MFQSVNDVINRELSKEGLKQTDILFHDSLIEWDRDKHERPPAGYCIALWTKEYVIVINYASNNFYTTVCDRNPKQIKPRYSLRNRDV